MGTPEFAVPSLLALVRSRHIVAAAVSQPDKPSGRGLSVKPTPVRAAALERGIEVIAARSVRSRDFLDQVRAISPDVLAVVAFGRILPDDLLEMAPHGGVNLHASLLPKYRGAAPAAWAIARGETVTGVTTMKIESEMDAGDVFLQRSLAIGDQETAGQLQERLARLGAPLLVESLDALEAGTLAGLPQDPSAATYAPILRKEDGRIDWKMEAAAIERRVRAFDPWPAASTTNRGRWLRIWKARPLPTAPAGPRSQPGEILQASREGLRVACGGGSLLDVLELQPEGRRRMSSAEAVAGRYFGAGELLA